VADEHAVAANRAVMVMTSIRVRIRCRTPHWVGHDVAAMARRAACTAPSGCGRTDTSGRTWRTAVEVELTRKTEVRVAAILRQLLESYDDVVYRAHPSAAPVVQRAAAALPGRGAARVHVRSYPPPTLAGVA